MRIRNSLILSVVISSAIAACTNDDVSGPGFTCDVTNPVADVFLTPSSNIVLVHSPARETDVGKVVATATNRVGNVRSDVEFKFVSSDPSVATVDSAGVVHAIKPGTTRITASTCGEKASTDITVALIALTAKILLDTNAVVAGDSLTVKGRVIGQADTLAIPGAKFTFTASPPTGITIVQKTDSTALIRTSAPGTYIITAAAEGVNASTSLVVSPRVFIASANAFAPDQLTLDVGRDFGCGLIPLGRMYCWGVNGSTELATATDSICFEEQKGKTITQPCSLLPMRVSPSALTFGSLSAGDRFACGVTTIGAAYCWGDGNFGKIGNGQNGGTSVATLVTSGLVFRSVTAGGEHACGITTSGVAYCWGQDSSGQLGDARRVNSTTPIPVILRGGPASFSSISAGFRHTCALEADGTAYCWGLNDHGQLGTASSGGYADLPALVGGGLRFTSIVAGGDTVQQPPPLPPVRVESHTCAITVGGAAYCWGSNDSGQLGNGTLGGEASVPVPVAGGLTFSKIAVGAHHTCGLTTTGVAYCWGLNADLQLGQGQPTGAGPNSAVPSQVGGGQAAGVTFTAISAGTRHSCAIGSDGNAYCWGSNIFGALGNTLQAGFRGAPQRVATPK